MQAELLSRCGICLPTGDRTPVPCIARDGAVVQTWALRRPVPDLRGGAGGAWAALSGLGVHKARAPVFKERIGSEPRQGDALHRGGAVAVSGSMLAGHARGWRGLQQALASQGAREAAPTALDTPEASFCRKCETAQKPTPAVIPNPTFLSHPQRQ
uniref:Uncharacterized protein n=1 Tax=Rangifer tarandus platyrhynchus TaxID=3082113 RepID=A0ACB0EAR4_RANTA|nr:unnamed protein product [Rangifer tarandus platyrhynchus]